MAKMERDTVDYDKSNLYEKNKENRSKKLWNSENDKHHIPNEVFNFYIK